MANLQKELIGGRSPKAVLSPKGEIQAANLGKYFQKKFLETGQKLDVIYASPLVRCEQTAKICLENYHSDLISKIKFDERLTEFSQGDWEGKIRSQIYTLQTQNLINKQKSWFKPPKGESLRMLKNRATNFLETEIMNKFWQNDWEKDYQNSSENYQENLQENLRNLQTLEEIKQEKKLENKDLEQKTIVIFGHGMWIKVLLMEVLGLDQIVTVNLQVDNCSLTELEFGDFGWRLCRFNQVLEI